MVDADMDFVPTPSVSRAIIRYNESTDGRASVLLLIYEKRKGRDTYGTK